MHLPDVALASLASLTKRTPRFPGLGRGYRFLNRMLLGCGAVPVVDARMKDGTTMRVDLRTHTELDAFYRGEYDPELLTLVLAILDPGAYFLDVGANVGFYSVAVARHMKHESKGGRVVAFEPVESNYQRLVENMRKNDLLDCSQICQVGISNRTGEVMMTLREDFVLGGETGNASIAINPEFDSGFPTIQVTLAQLDELWPQVAHPGVPVGLIKLDIEGHEDCALEGARRTLEAHRPVILMEVNKPYFRARRLDLDERFFGLFPPEYVIFCEKQGAWTPVTSLNRCAELDNVFIIPGERVQQPSFAAFRGT